MLTIETQSAFINLHLSANNMVSWPLMHCTRPYLLSSHNWNVRPSLIY